MNIKKVTSIIFLYHSIYGNLLINSFSDEGRRVVCLFIVTVVTFVTFLMVMSLYSESKKVTQYIVSGYFCHLFVTLKSLVVVNDYEKRIG